MRKFLISAAFFAAISFSYAQEDKDLATWYHKDFATTNVYGINTENAYRFLESKGLKPQTVVVGVLDSGVQVDHPGLIKNMWTNPGEIAGNGKDDDKNGYVDDIHGWNFQGGKDGDVDVDNMEVTRVVKKYRPIFEGENSAQNKANQGKMPTEFAMYMKAKDIFQRKSIEARRNYEYYKALQERVPAIVATLNGMTLTQENLAKIQPKDAYQAQYRDMLSNLLRDPSLAGKTPAEVEAFLSKQMKGALDYFEPQATKQYDLDFDPRGIVGDNYDDVNERFYGNNHYEGPDAQHGTHVAGIIAGYPHDGNIQYGVASRVAKIMTVRAVPDGDERDKDVANAIRYAVDNGAKVLNMSFGKPISPNKDKVWEAFKYAQDKGVLLVKAAGNENEDIVENEYFPTNYKSVNDKQPFVTNMIVVGASTKDNDGLRAGFSNFNSERVDLFAPGAEIYSTVPKNEYEYLQGTSMASPVVAGAAAVLFAYMPQLTPQQVKEALMKTVNRPAAQPGQEVPFTSYSASGGVIDLYKAAQYAYNNFYQNKTTKPVLRKTATPSKGARRVLAK
ncbi:MAG: peptidase S8 [Chryseobacterium sp.]|nr:MAG: peptidase S8 [Chryseobacterium sp.]